MLIPLVRFRLDESRGDSSRLDLPGLVLAGVGLLGIVWGLVRGNSLGWSSPEILGAIVAGLAFIAAFVAWELRTPDADAADALLPRPGLRAREHRVALLLVRDVRLDLPARPVLPDGAGLLAARLRACGSCPWTAMPMIVAPIAGALSDRIGGHRLMGAGLLAAGHRARLDRGRLDAVDAVPRHRRAVRSLRDRHGALLRAGHERRPLPGALRGAGQGLGREQHDPRARRRARGGRARLDLRPLRRLPNSARRSSTA